VKISTEKLCDEISDKGDKGRARRGKLTKTDMSSKGEMKTSLRLMIW
jgi:hypothetical protein